MKTILILPIVVLATINQLQGQEKNGLEAGETKVSIRLPQGQPHPTCIIAADKKQIQLLDSETFGGSLSMYASLNGINPDWIQSISVVKGKSATDRFGSVGQGGVIYITLKNGSLKNLSPELAHRFKRVKHRRG